MYNNVENYQEAVIKTMLELKKLGVRVSKSALESAKDIDTITEYFNDACGIDDCADLLILLR